MPETVYYVHAEGFNIPFKAHDAQAAEEFSRDRLKVTAETR